MLGVHRVPLNLNPKETYVKDSDFQMAHLGRSCKWRRPNIIVLTLLLLLLIGDVDGVPADAELTHRRNFVRAMMKGAWHSYRAHAWGEYAVNPLTNEPAFDAGGPGTFQVGATILASLDTLHIMDLTEEFELARGWATATLNFTSLDGWIEIDTAFEEFVSGLLSAYFLTNDYGFVLKAQEIVESFLPNFNSSTGLPYRARNPAKNQTNTEDVATYLSELGTFRLEFLALSNLTGKPEFRLKADHVMDFLRNNFPRDGLFKDTIDVRKGEPFGGRDIVYPESSFHLSLLNDWLQLGNTHARNMFDRMLGSFREHGMLKLDSKPGLLHLTDRRANKVGNTMRVDHCLSGGVFALAAMSNDSTKTVELSQDLLSIAKRLTRTCREVSKAMNAGLAPNRFAFDAEREKIIVELAWNDLGPHVAYSYFILYRLTGDPMYREWGWEMTQNIERYAKAGVGNRSMTGYSGFLNVASSPSIRGGIQEPYFLGGTLKFLYLLFSNTSYYDLRVWVFNAKGHLMPVAGPSRLHVVTENLSAKTSDLTPGFIAIYIGTASATAGVVTLLLWFLWWQRRMAAPTMGGVRTTRMHSSMATKANDDPIDFQSNSAPAFTGVTGLL